MESLLEQVKLLEESNNKLSNENSTLKATIARLSEVCVLVPRFAGLCPRGLAAGPTPFPHPS
jgi:hypothetical protein